MDTAAKDARGAERADRVEVTFGHISARIVGLLRTAVLVVLPGLLSCAAPPEMHELIDLAAALPAADVQVETSSINIGTAEARRFLRRGWWRDEVDRGSGESFVWSRGLRSRVEFFVAWKRDLGVELRCRPLQFEGAPVQIVTVLLNGDEIGRHKLRNQMRSYELSLPADLLQPGCNTLEFLYRYHRKPAEVIAGSKDNRELAVAWERLVFSGPSVVSYHEPVIGGQAGVVELPAASRADFFLHLPAGAVLCVDGVEGADKVCLRLSVLADGAQEAELELPRDLERGFRIPLEAPQGLARLRFHLAPIEGHAGSGVRTLNPRILAPIGESLEAALPPAVEPSPSGPPPHLIIYLIDALRADRLGCYGNPRSLSPRIDTFAREGVVFEQTVAQSSWTKASVASIFTGLWPPAHGANGPDDILPEAVPLLAERFAEAGYQTAAFVANAYVNRPFGFARGFASFRYYPVGEGPSEALNQGIEQWLDRRRAGPCLLFVHTIDPHEPYAAPQRFRERFAGSVQDPEVGQVTTVRGMVNGSVSATDELRRDLEALYDAEVAHNDAGFGDFLDLLQARGLYEDSVILLVSDHGEAFGEHGTWTHGLDLHHEVLHVPMILRLPRGHHGGVRVREPVQHIDILPTMLGLAGVMAPAEGRGRNLLVPAAEPPVVVSYLDYWGRRGVSALSARWKYIEPLSEEFGTGPMLFDRLRDPLEQRNLADERPVVVGFLASRIRNEMLAQRAPQRSEMDEATKEQLKALGYLE